MIMSAEDLRQALVGQMKNRAMMYYYIYKETSEEVGPEKAAVILKRAIYKRGLDVGKMLTEYGPDNLQGLKEAFMEKVVPYDGSMFAPEIISCDSEELNIKFHRCPLKEAYLEAGLSEDETANMLDIAAQVDYGTFEGAGFSFQAETWRPGKKGCCHLHIKPAESKK
jgi:hypothetical protein